MGLSHIAVVPRLCLNAGGVLLVLGVAEHIAIVRTVLIDPRIFSRAVIVGLHTVLIQ